MEMVAAPIGLCGLVLMENRLARCTLTLTIADLHLLIAVQSKAT
jgi:hypothetical protein